MAGRSNDSLDYRQDGGYKSSCRDIKWCSEDTGAEMSGKVKVVKEKFSCERDGMTIRGLYFRPAANTGQTAQTGLPIAIVSHGFMANYGTTKGYAKWFAEHGYAAFCFDFNGGCAFGHSDKDRTKMTLYTELEDLKAVLVYAKGRSETDAACVTLMGCSQGGFVSAMLAAELAEKHKEKSGNNGPDITAPGAAAETAETADPEETADIVEMPASADEIQKLILFYPALCIPDDARAGRMMIMKFDPDNIPEYLKFGPIKLGGCYPRAVIDKHYEDMISPYEGPVLIAWGTKDGIVAEKYVDGAKAAYKNAVLYKIPDAHHGFNKKADKIALPYVENFLQNK